MLGHGTKEVNKLKAYTIILVLIVSKVGKSQQLTKILYNIMFMHVPPKTQFLVPKCLTFSVDTEVN